MTDCKSLFDAVTRIESSGLHLIEKRTALEILSLKERSGGRGVQHLWISGDQNLADALTKTNLNALESLQKAMTGRKWRIQYDENFVSGRKKKAALRAKVLKEIKSQATKWSMDKEEAQQVHFIFFDNGTFGLSTSNDMIQVSRDKCFDICTKRFKVRW